MRILIFLYVLSYTAKLEACDTCSLSDWFQWSSCTEACGGGIQSRQRSLCCPVNVPYGTCLNGLCRDLVANNDTSMTDECNTECYNGGTYDSICICPSGWTGKCCEIPCGDTTFGIKCTDSCECGNNSSCNQLTGECTDKDTVVVTKACGDTTFGIKCTDSCECGNNSSCNQLTGECTDKDTVVVTKDGLECNICDQRNWEQWSSCNQQCGGGLRSRHQEICCPETMDYDMCVHQRCKDIIVYEDIKQVEPCNTNCYNGGLFNESCQCKPGWTGKCCQSHCDDGYYGDGCNATCDCSSDAKCDKATGVCLIHVDNDTEDTSPRLYIIIGAAVGAFVIVQMLIIIAASIYIKDRRMEKIKRRLDKGKFWIGGVNSNTAQDSQENHYEEIPLDSKVAGKSTNSTIDILNRQKRSMKKGSLRKGSSKGSKTKGGKTEDMYQFLSQTEDDCGYQSLVVPTAIHTPIYIPKLESNKPKYMYMEGQTIAMPCQSEEAGYMAMNNQAGHHI